MSFPAPAASAETNAGVASSTPLNANLPSSISAGELLVLYVFNPGANNVPINTPSGWTSIAGVTISPPGEQCFAKIADGAEGSTVGLTTSNGANRTIWVYAERYGTSAHASTLPEGLTAAGGGQADIGSLNPANWGTEDTRWVIMGIDSGGLVALPSGYSSVYNPGGTIRLSAKDANAASEDPAAFTGSGDTIGILIAIRPAAVVALTSDRYNRLYGPAKPGTSAATLYTVPTGAKAEVRNVYVNNPTAGVVKVTLSIGSDSAATRFMELWDVPAGESRQMRRGMRHLLESGEFIQGYQDTASGAVVIIDGFVEVA